MSKMEVQTPASAETDWDQVREWDEQYVFHVLATKDEYRSNVVESADGCYVTMADGRRIFDFANQLICVNMGHRHPKIVAGDPGSHGQVRLRLGGPHDRVSGPRRRS